MKEREKYSGKPREDVVNIFFMDTLRSLHESVELKDDKRLIVFGIQQSLIRALTNLIMNCVIHYDYKLMATFAEGGSRELNADNYWLVIANFYKTTKIEVSK